MAGWRVWGELRRRAHIELVWAFLGGRDGQIQDVGDGRRIITLDARLDQRERRAALGHELIHDERGIFFTSTSPPALVAKEEAIVEAETARRLVPLDELDDLVRQAVLNDESVTWREVAEWFDVPQEIAEQAMLQLGRRSRASHPAARASFERRWPPAA
jgi:hypothetical protein